MSFQGVEFTPEMRKMVVNVKQFFDNVKITRDIFEKPAAQLAVAALNISESTVIPFAKINLPNKPILANIVN